MAEKESTSSGGRSDTNPTVSINNACNPDGNLPACAVTSSVANSLFSGFILVSPVNALINDVFPVERLKVSYTGNFSDLCILSLRLLTNNHTRQTNCKNHQHKTVF